MPFLVQDSQTKNLGPSAHDFGYDLLEYEYMLTVEGKVTGFFQRLTGGKIEIATVSHDIVFEDGSSTTLFIPGATSFEAFTLERGFANYNELYDWFSEASNGRIIQARRNGSVVMTRHGEPMLWWNFTNAWPTKLAGFNYNQYADAQKARVAITIAAEGITYEDLDTSANEAPTVSAADFNEWFNG